MAADTVLIVNSNSRKGHIWFDRAKTILGQSKSLNLVSATCAHTADEMPALAAKAVADGVPLVVVGGGDGTIGSCVEHFIGSKSVLGILPTGTGNQFARDLKIPAKLEGACKIISEGKDAKVDIGRAGGRYFVNVATVGLTTRIARVLSSDAKRLYGRLIYAYALIKAISKTKTFEATIRIGPNEGSVTRLPDVIQVVIGNGRFHAGPFLLSPDASIVEGQLTIYALECESKWTLLKFALKLPGGKHVNMKEVSVFSTTEGRLETNPVKHVTIDGEIDVTTPVDFSVLPGAITVRVPNDSVTN